MVAITVILAAVIGTFVLGLGDQVSSNAPQASFTFDYGDQSSDYLLITHDGGDSIDSGQLNTSTTGATSATTTLEKADAFSSGEVTAGTSYNMTASHFGDGSGSPLGTGDNLDLSAATIRVVWNADSGDSTATLGKWNGPDA